MQDRANKVIANVKVIVAMKSAGKTDGEIAKYLGMRVTNFLEIIEGDEYLREVYEKAGEKLGSEIESEFLIRVMEKLEEGKTEDARWYLERTNAKYQRKDSVNLSITSIDEVIRQRGE